MHLPEAVRHTEDLQCLRHRQARDLHIQGAAARAARAEELSAASLLRQEVRQATTEARQAAITAARHRPVRQATVQAVAAATAEEAQAVAVATAEAVVADRPEEGDKTTIKTDIL